jgi:hypothetical protein
MDDPAEGSIHNHEQRVTHWGFTKRPLDPPARNVAQPVTDDTPIESQIKKALETLRLTNGSIQALFERCERGRVPREVMLEAAVVFLGQQLEVYKDGWLSEVERSGNDDFKKIEWPEPLL